MTIFEQLCDLGGQLTGTQSERNALAYVEGYLSSLTNGQLQKHAVAYPGWSSTDCWIEIDNVRYKANALPQCGALPEGTSTLPVIDAGRGTLEDLEKLNGQITGKAVVVSHEYMFGPDHVHRITKHRKACDLGAAAFVIANDNPNTGAVCGSVDGGIAGFGVSQQTGNLLRRAESARFCLRSETTDAQTSTLDWLIPSTSPDADSQKEVIVCAHIDGHAISESALDNATGVAVALAISAELNNSNTNGCAVRVLIFSAEELGLFGSEAYVKALSPEQRAAIRAVVNLDCVAGSLDFGAMTSGFPKLNHIVEAAANIVGIPVKTYDPLLANSDHYNFAVAGIPALRLIAGFDEQDSKLQNVLTEGDNRSLCSKDELIAAMALTREMVRIASR